MSEFKEVATTPQQDEFKSAIIEAAEEFQDIGPAYLFAVIGLAVGELAGLYAVMSSMTKEEILKTVSENAERGYSGFFDNHMIDTASVDKH